MIGVGAISGIYLKNITNVFKEVELVGVCDLIPERAEKGVQTVKEYIEAGAKAPVPKIYKDMYEAFNDPEVEVVLNLTRPYEHYGVTKAALETRQACVLRKAACGGHGGRHRADGARKGEKSPHGRRAGYVHRAQASRPHARLLMTG